MTTTYSQARSGYFNAGRPTTVASSLGNGTLQFDYDALGRVVKQTRTLDGTNYTVQKNFDTSGFLRGMQYPDGDTIGQFGGSGTALGYDQAGRLSSIPGILTSVTYNALGAPLVQTNANGTVTTKTYDADRFWLTHIGTVSPSLTLQNLSYTLNDAGMATQVTSPFGAEGWTYGYDELNRLTSSTNAGSSADNQTWAYDSLGRITNNSRIGSYTYGGSRPHAVTAAGSNSYSYDSNGNLTTGGGRSLTWDASNMITQVVMGGNATSFSYGPDGDRIKKTAGANVAKYPFGDDYEINGSTTTKYFDAGFGVIAKKAGTTLYWLHTDRLGSINATTDGSGAEVLRRSYRSYGELLGQTGTDTESLDYIGQRTDSETGLTYLHARYYDSQLGMFVSPDPAGADRNSYRYSFGDSVNFSDPGGLQADSCVSGVLEDCPRFWDAVTVSVSGLASSISSGARSIIVQMLTGWATAPGSPDNGGSYQGRGTCTGVCGADASTSGSPASPAPTPTAVPAPAPAPTPEKKEEKKQVPIDSCKDAQRIQKESLAIRGTAIALGAGVNMKFSKAVGNAASLLNFAMTVGPQEIGGVPFLSRVVPPSQSMDYKTTRKNEGVTPAQGNQNFGVVAAAYGFDKETAQRGAGLVQWAFMGDIRGVGVPWGPAPHGDEWDDYRNIGVGHDRYTQGGCSAK